MGVTVSVTAFVLNMPLGLAVIYGLAAVLWYELLRSALVGRFARRRIDRPRVATVDGESEREREREAAEREAREREAAEREAKEASEPDLGRRLYYLARKAAQAERDLAIQTANEATKRAVQRIERRYREVSAELDDDEAERLRMPQSTPTVGEALALIADGATNRLDLLEQAGLSRDEAEAELRRIDAVGS
jgi:colicin import membrane protein